MRENNKGVSWARFLEIFYDKYFPQCARDRKVSEFMELKQNNMAVAEHEAKFTELARFAPHVVDTDYKKARDFEGGLRDDILEKVNVLKLETDIEVLDQAIILEANIARQAKPTTDWKGGALPTLTFTGKELPPEGSDHSKPLYISVECKEKWIPVVLVDTGSAINVCPSRMAYVIGLKLADFAPTTQVIRGYDNTSREVMGTVRIKTQVSPV
ncbi:uncharacterized protein LOC114319629 [Camellia sinensis]|uniref:uncharacterized protein LOC114319629 n=1 Tax=Camellia sinensis TaxID=4442 RepID=UPI00103677EC|nr:uncharacterized protein LOC114319629 [Camellia sinensis]